MRRRGAGPAALVLALMAGLVTPTAVHAQSLLGVGGLGFPVDAVDARSRALGSLGVGLFGPSISPTDPASAADLRVAAVMFGFQSSWVEVDGPAQPDASGTRFPVLGVAYPVGRFGMATLTAGSVLDQRWQTQFQREIDLGEEFARVTDTFSSDGGVSALRLGFARRIAPSLAVGASVGRLTGEVRRSFNRTFDSLSIEGQIPSFIIGGQWDYGGWTGSVGATVDVGDVFRASGTVTWSGSLDADPTPETQGSAATFDVPTEYRLGASGVLAPGVNLTAGMSYADWSVSSLPGDTQGAGKATLGYGVGLEWEGARIIGSSSPLRLGYRRTELPFLFEGDSGVESVWAGGLGLNLVEQENIPLARIDLALERGSRDAGRFSESFWRSSVTLRVAGF